MAGFDQSSTEGSPVFDLDIPKKGDASRWTAYVDELLGYLRSTKLGHEFHWREALLFLTDEQWIRWANTTQTFRRHNMEEWVPTPVTNYIVKMFDRIIDILTAGDLMGTGRPASKRQDDIDRAKAATRILKSLYHDLDTPDTFEEAAGWLTITGNMVLFSGWDKDAGKVIKIPQMDIIESPMLEDVGIDPLTGDVFDAGLVGELNPNRVDGGILQPDTRQALNENGEPVFDVRREQRRDEEGNAMFDEFREGNVFERAVNPFGFFPQPRSRFKDVDYCVEVTAETPDDIASLFGTKWRGKIVPEDVNILGWGAYLASQHGAMLMRHTGESKEYGLLKYFRHKPSDAFPGGKLVITVGDILLHEGHIDTIKSKDGELPYEMTPYRRVPGELWGHGPFRSAIPLQKRLNAIDSAIIHNRKTMIMPKWKVPNRSGIRTIEGKPGAMIRWDSHNLPRGIEPTPVPGIPLPPQVMEERKATLQDLEEVVGTLEVLAGRQPSGVETLGQHQLLLEQATRRFSPIIKRWKRALARHERHKLRIARERWHEEREVAVIGEGEAIESFHYSSADISGVDDVFVEMESELVYSRAMQEHKIKEAFSMGLLGDPRNPEVQMKVLEKLNIPGFKNEFTVDAERARRNIHKIVNENNLEVQPMPFDIFPVHFKIITDNIKSADFESYSQEVQQALTQLAMAYQQAMQQQAMQAQQAAMATKGAGPAAEEQVVQSGAFGGAPQAETLT